MLIFTCSTSKPSGVLLTKSIIRLSAFMPIIGRISEGNPIFSITSATKFVKIGNLAHSLQSTMRDAPTKLFVSIATVGKNKNTTLYFTKLNHVKKRFLIINKRDKLLNAREVLNVLITILLKTKDSLRWLSNKGIDLIFCMIKFLKCL